MDLNGVLDLALAQHAPAGCNGAPMNMAGPGASTEARVCGLLMTLNCRLHKW